MGRVLLSLLSCVHSAGMWGQSAVSPCAVPFAHPTGTLLCRLKPRSRVSCSLAAEPTSHHGDSRSSVMSGLQAEMCSAARPPKRPGPVQRAGSLRGSSFLIALPRLLCQGQPGGCRFNELLFYMTSSIIGEEQTGGGFLK